MLKNRGQTTLLRIPWWLFAAVWSTLLATELKTLGESSNRGNREQEG
ncbi:MAG: hypothetical protein QW506_02305 [Thermoproteota archaeon]